jgi:hypothetical protein
MYKQARDLKWGAPGAVAAALVLVLLTLGAGCAKDHSMDKVHNPLDPAATGLTPPIPRDVEASVGNRRVELTWALHDSALVSSIIRYRVYKRETGKPLTLVDSTAAPPLSVSGLVNDVQYSFSVAAVLGNGLEGKRSDEISATPGVFSLVIDNGQERVNSTSARLSLLAPVGTQGVRVSNSQDATGAPTLSYLSSL